jgi:uncharacterized protein (TIGR02996 family)
LPNPLRVRVAEIEFLYVDGRALVGSAPENDLVLPHASVSPRHVELTALDADAFVRRLEGAPPVWLNGAPVQRARIDPGDILQIGEYLVEILAPHGLAKQEVEWLELLAADPKRDDVRQAYHRWLDENDRTADGAFIRAQLTFVDASSAPRYPAYLGAGFGVSARRLLARLPIEHCNIPECPSRWSELRPTEYPNQRVCNECTKTVHYTRDVFAARRQVHAGNPVVYDAHGDRYAGDIIPTDTPPDTERTPTRPPPSIALPPPSSNIPTPRVY